MSEKNIQPFQCKLGVLSRTDGSALLSQGTTSILVGLYGPVESKAQKLLIDKANVEIHFRPKAGLPGVADKLNEGILRNICEISLVTALHPRSSVIVVIQKLQDGGGLISCAVNAACLAMLDSGIDMKFLVAGVCCALNENENYVINPSQLIVDNAKAVFEFVFENVEEKIIAAHTTGSFNLQQYDKALDLCRKNSVQVFNFYKNAISCRIKKYFE